jgi:lysozyme
MASAMTPRVVDISHHNVVKDLKATAAAGVWGVIHKASQGRAYRDPDYAARREAAAAAGMLWGAYHFNTGDDVAAQVANFLRAAKPDNDTLMVLDYEDNRPSQMSINQAIAFLHMVEQKLGRKAAIYSGNRLKETIGGLSPMERDYVLQHRLWLCQYGPKAVLPTGFKTKWLWQYTGDGIGPAPHNVPGIVAGNGGIDLNAFDGTRAQLAAAWA